MNTTPRKFYDIDLAGSTPTPDKKMTPMAAHRTFYEVLKKHQQENKCFLTSNEIHTILNALEEYASQQAPAMYTREQVERAVDFGFRQCKLQEYISPSQKQQFIQSLK